MADVKRLALILLLVLSACGGGSGPMHVLTVQAGQQVQLTQGGESIFVMPYRNLEVAAQLAGRRFGWVYLADEMFWTGKAVQIGLDEAAINSAAALVRAQGMLVMVSILPEVIAHPDFRLDSPGSYDVIGIDVYLANGYAQPPAQVLAQAIATLRDKGYGGEVWFIYQGFGTLTPEQQSQQDEAIRLAPGLGITGLVEYCLT